jgi:phenylacetate-coenzyme A ligase PaaK-like adenylate-forming protein
MKTALSKKLENVFAFKDLVVLKRHNLRHKSIYNIQNKRIEKLMQHAYTIPFYRKKFEQAGVLPSDFHCKEDLTRFPLLTKAELKQWITDELKANPEKYKDHRIYHTSGSTGNPLHLCATPEENAIFTANWLRISMENGVNPFFEKTMALKDPAIVAQGDDSFLQKLGILRRYKTSFVASGQKIAEDLNAIKPEFFYAAPTKIMEMVEYAIKNNVTLHHPKAYASISENLSAQNAARIKQYLGDNIFTSFGCMETGACTFTEVGDLNKHIVTNDTHVINVVDEKNQRAASGRMVITNLFLYEFPIINYDIGDGADTVEEDGVEYLVNIKGRLNDAVILEDGRTFGFHPFYIATEKLDELIHFRVIQTGYHAITFEAVATSASADKAKMENHIISTLNGVITDYPMEYSFRWKDRIEADPNGKSRYIVNQIPNKES